MSVLNDNVSIVFINKFSAARSSTEIGIIARARSLVVDRR